MNREVKLSLIEWLILVAILVITATAIWPFVV